MIKEFFNNLYESFKKKWQSTNLSEENEQKSTTNDQKIDDDYEDVVEYREVLYSDRPDQVYKKRHRNRKILFTDVEAVESDIDHIDKKEKAESGDVERKVDFLISKKKEKIENPSPRKKANVIYVVSKPQPGQVKGDWAVRSHYKIFSHHRTKQAAIKKARKIAVEKKATVLVQNVDGTFSNGFKPRAKKK